jgi:hypothetical protein
MQSQELAGQMVDRDLSSVGRPEAERPDVLGQPFARYVVDAYLSCEHLEDIDGCCPLIGLPSDAARSGQAVKSAYQQVAESMVRLFEVNLNGPEAREQALVFVALCVGRMVLTRAIDDEVLGDELRKSAERRILTTTGWRERGRPYESRSAARDHAGKSTAFGPVVDQAGALANPLPLATRTTSRCNFASEAMCSTIESGTR